MIYAQNEGKEGIWDSFGWESSIPATGFINGDVKPCKKGIQKIHQNVHTHPFSLHTPVKLGFFWSKINMKLYKIKKYTRFI